MHWTPASHAEHSEQNVSLPHETPTARDESSADLTMNALTQAQASAATARAEAMFQRVLTGWASDVLQLERRLRLTRQRAAERAMNQRSAA